MSVVNKQGDLFMDRLLANSQQADLVTIRWPDGKVSTFHSVAADHAYNLGENEKAPRLIR